MSIKPQGPHIGRFAVPLLFWVIIGPIAALLAWLLMKKKSSL
jgi:hypothetical protein